MATGDDFSAQLRSYDPTDSDGLGDLFPLVYDELRRIARHQLKRSNQQTLDTTGLVHEAFLKMVDQSKASVQDRAHFLAISSMAMRQVLVSAARKRLSAKRGDGRRPVTLEERADRRSPPSLEDVLAVDTAMAKLREIDERLCRLVECRFFAGLTESETALALQVSESTAQRDWRRAKAWLRRYLDQDAAV